MYAFSWFERASQFLAEEFLLASLADFERPSRRRT
jgi:hypothetical protein